ncbi:hypothetical protein C8J57DRAFT_1505991 [Mycena rebaudengoi]|nr:hypothetical protein C8J57DRAFT_1505991 [Mycena rebaudengoi]
MGEQNKQTLQGIQSGGSNLEERVLGMVETLAGVGGQVQEMTMVFDHLSRERAIQDSTVAVTLEALAKATDDLHDTCVEAHNNPQMVTAGMGSGTVRISTKQPRVAAPLIFNGNVKKGGAQVEIVEAKIEASYQGKATATMFFTVLDTLNQGAGFDTVSLICQVKKGLDQKVLQAIYAQPVLPMDYAGWKSAASHLRHR